MQIPLEEKEEKSDLMKSEKEVEDEEAEVVKEDLQEEQRPCYSKHSLAHPQTQAKPPVPMVTSARHSR